MRCLAVATKNAVATRSLVIVLTWTSKKLPPSSSASETAFGNPAMREACVGQVVEVALTGFAMIALSFALELMHSALFDFVGLAPNALDASG